MKLPDSVALALEAFHHGQSEVAKGNRSEGRRWLDRAHRLVPRDQMIALALAAAYLGDDDAEAMTRFAGIVAGNDVREAWLGLATARWRLGDPDGAATALAGALRRHVSPRDSFGLADAIASAAGALGWCGVTRDGELIVRPDGLPVHREMTSGPLSVLSVTTRDGRHLLGSPLDLTAMTATTGCVSMAEGGLVGWAWHPGNPDVDPVLTIRPAYGRKQLLVTASDVDVPVSNNSLLGRPRGFAVPAAALRGMPGPLHVLGRDGRDLLGSPLDPRAVPAPMPVDATIPRLAGPSVRRSPVAVVMPVYGGANHTLACIDSVLRTLRRPAKLIVVDDASPDRGLIQALDALAKRRRITLIRNPHNLGFVATANAGISAAAGHDIVLLNSDTLVAGGWLEELRSVAYGAPNIGTVTPLSNDATIVNYPNRAGGNDQPDMAATARIAALARRVNGGVAVDIPVGVGFCMYIRRACVDAVGLLRADVFAQGYGEENDFCLRARRLGWRHVAAPGTFVAHIGGHSFGAAAQHLRARNAILLEQLHPGYDALIEAHGRADPLALARRRLDLARWRAGRPRGSKAIVVITHGEGGGVERRIEAAVERYRSRGYRVVVLRPSQTASGARCIAVSDGIANDFPNLCYAMPDEYAGLRRLLAAERPDAIELHHMIGHHPDVLHLIGDLGVPYDVHVHDYAWLCARVALVGPAERYCGEPDARQCDVCVAAAGNLIDEDISVAALRRRSARLFAGARRLCVPSEDAAARIRRHFPKACPLPLPHEDDTGIAAPAEAPASPGRCRVCVIGAIGVHKGYQVVLDCALDAVERRLPVDFVIVGHTIDDRQMLATGRVFVTGSYAPDEAVELIRAQQANLALLPSIFPETWCRTLTEAWRAGLKVAAFDIGAQAERIRRTGRGFVLPLGLSAPAINNALLAAAGLSRHE
jgi:GT2 family glycosyltransferase/glycosyltransferase involved in cell wall biosynthesis